MPPSRSFNCWRPTCERAQHRSSILPSIRHANRLRGGVVAERGFPLQNRLTTAWKSLPVRHGAEVLVDYLERNLILVIRERKTRMKLTNRRISSFAATVAAALLFLGCGHTSPAWSITLCPTARTQAAASTRPSSPSPCGRGPAGSSGTPQIVTRTGESTVSVSDFQRWRVCSEGLLRVLVENLNILLQDAAQQRPRRHRAGPEFIVAVHVNRFDGRPRTGCG